MFELGLKALIAYLAGSVMGAMVMGRLRGVDIRAMGSGNAGATNALRVQGFAFAAGVAVIDVGKALLATGLLPVWRIPGIGLDPEVSRQWLAVACATGAVAGHVWPLYHEFRGGKGAATLLGAVAVMTPGVLLPVLGVWLVCVMLWGMVGLATMAAGATLPVALLASGAPLPFIAFGIVMAGFLVYTHRSNIARMRAGTEGRVRRLWLLRPRGMQR